MSAAAARLTLLARTGTGQPGLVRTLAEVPPAGQHGGLSSAGGELWFVIAGTGQLTLNDQPGPALIPDRGLLIPAGTRYTVESDADAWLRLDVVALPSGPAAPAVALSRDLRDCPAETTGDRSFRVLFGPGRDCAVATQFAGDIPPGRAPEHSHPYDEVVLVLQGSGVAHAGGTDRDLRPGSCVQLPPGQPHCLENTGSQPLRILGVFHPAGSPAAKLPPGAGAPPARAS